MEKSERPAPREDLLAPVRDRRDRVTTLEALEADLRLWGDPTGALIETARAIASAIDSGPSPQELTRLSTELRLLMRTIKEALRPQTTELDEILGRIRATEFDGRGDA